MTDNCAKYSKAYPILKMRTSKSIFFIKIPIGMVEIAVTKAAREVICFQKRPIPKTHTAPG